MEEVLSGWWLQILAGILAILSGVITHYVRKVAVWLIAKAELNTSEQAAMQLLLDGMSLAQESLVREAKLASADGKLTSEEIKKAEAIALEYAKDLAEGPALDIIKSWTERRASSLIKQLLSKLKGKTSGNTTTNTSNDPEATA